MNTLEIEGDWAITREKLRRRWALLTDDDLQYVEGKYEELIARIQKRTGETRATVDAIIRDSASGCGCN